jgi:sugar phosphate isomerase/epimerase
MNDHELGPTSLVLCAGTVQGIGFAERVEAAAAGGFQAISLFADQYQRAREHEKLSDADMRSLLAERGLCIAELDPLLGWVPGLGDFGATESEFYRIADALGARSLNVALPFATSLPLDALASAFAALCDRAARHGLKVHLESLPWAQINTVSAAHAIVALASRQNGGLMIDVWHHFRSGAGNQALDQLDGARVLGVQLSDAPREPEPDPIGETLERRRLPGDGDIDLVDILRRLDAIGSRAPLGVEVFSTELGHLPAREIAKRAGDRVRELIAISRPH